MNFLQKALLRALDEVFRSAQRDPAPMIHMLDFGDQQPLLREQQQQLERLLSPREPQQKPVMPPKTIAEPETIHVVDIKHHGEQITLPVGMGLRDAINTLERRADYEEEDTSFIEEFDVFPLDGAHALLKVFEKKFGWAQNIQTGWSPPAMIACRTGPKPEDTVNVPWAAFRFPAPLRGTIEPGVGKKDGRFVFRVTANVLRRDEPAVRELFGKLRDYLKKHSIYRGKAIAVRFFDNEGKALPLPEPTFMDTDVNETSLTFPADTMAAVRTNLFTPITRLKDLIANDIPVKRGVLLGGTYGTGKTMTAKVASKFAVEAGITFIYVRRANELAHSIQFAKCYSEPAVVIFCEDIDQVTDGKRDVAMNDVLNTLDGVDTKSMNLITLLTTNHVEKITQAMLRPGRLDAVITIPPPDQAAVEKLLRIYGNGSIPKNANLAEVAQELDGAIPAIIAEVVKRAKLSQLALQEPGTKIVELSAAALLEAARTMRAQRDLLAPAPIVVAEPARQH